MNSSPASLLQRVKRYRLKQAHEVEPQAQGYLTRSIGLTLEAVGLQARVGDQCEVMVGDQKVEAEVVGFSNDKIYLMPIDAITGVQPGARVMRAPSHGGIKIGPQALGRVINGLGKPIDGKTAYLGDDFLPFTPTLINPLHRHPIDQPLDVGIQAINALNTVGRGQRLGLFAGSGVGKSVLLGMMTKYTTADVVVVGLIGERGREVKEFIDHSLGEEGLRRAVVVASPADDVPLMRLRASQLATRIAEYFRDQGLNVLLLMDSLTRYAQAQREISLAIGEPPATKGYPPSVFAKIPQLVERAGNAAKGAGSITAFYTVLTEGDDLQDPIADAARAILDGHIVLSRQLADEGIYPAVDVEKSISRVMPNIVPQQQLANMQRFKQLSALYRQNRDLISVGAYSPGNDLELDVAVERQSHLRNFIRQGLNQAVSYGESAQNLEALIAPSRMAAQPAGKNPQQQSAFARQQGPLARQANNQASGKVNGQQNLNGQQNSKGQQNLNGQRNAGQQARAGQAPKP